MGEYILGFDLEWASSTMTLITTNPWNMKFPVVYGRLIDNKIHKFDKH